MHKLLKNFIIFSILTLYSSIVSACGLEGVYKLNWLETNDQKQLNPLDLKIVSAGNAPRVVLEGIQATSATDCRVDFLTERQERRYLMPFEYEQYLNLGWQKEYAASKINCFWSDLFFICRSTSNQQYSFDCPRSDKSADLSHEASILCSIRKNVDEYFVKKKFVFNLHEYFGASVSGVFKIERVQNE